MKIPFLILVASACLSLSACGGSLWPGYRDDPYAVNFAQKSTPDVLRSVNAGNRDERQTALRTIAGRAGEARRQGYLRDAQELEEIIIRRYFVEREQEVRACIVRLCAPAVGRGSSAMVRFLRDRIAAGEFPGYAALSLATLGPKNAVLDIEPLTRHPAAEVRLQAATALCVLGDPKGYGAVVRVWKSMQKSIWPERIDGVSLEEARMSLEARARRGFGKDLK